jgi:hypothetical protein
LQSGADTENPNKERLLQISEKLLKIFIQHQRFVERYPELDFTKFLNPVAVDNTLLENRFGIDDSGNLTGSKLTQICVNDLKSDCKKI